MPGERITHFLIAGLLLASGIVARESNAGWDCRQDEANGTWSCTGAPALPEPAGLDTAPLPPASADVPVQRQPPAPPMRTGVEQTTPTTEPETRSREAAEEPVAPRSGAAEQAPSTTPQRDSTAEIATEPAGEVDTPAPEAAVTAEEEVVTKPAGEVDTPASEVVVTAKEEVVTRPAGEVDTPASEVAVTSEEEIVTRPAGEVDTPTSEVVVTAKEEVVTRPAGEVDTPASEVAVTAAAETLEPAVAEPGEASPATTDHIEPLPKTGGAAEPAENDAVALNYSRLEDGLTWAHCGLPPSGERFDPGPLADADQPIELSADAAKLFHLENRALLRGAVEVQRGDQQLEAEEVSYDRGSGVVRASGGVLLRQPGLRLLGREAEVNLNSRQGRVDDAHYRFIGINARGTAERAEIEGPNLARFENITYTACPPGSNAWELQADELEIDRAQGTGVARHAKVRVGGVPILYSPYLSFPLDDRRKSGVLLPSLGNSNKLGVDVSAPIYLNLAPNMDATLIPRYMSKRGAMLGGEYRFLTASETGKFYGEVIPDDREYADGGARGGISFEQQGRFGRRWTTDVNIDWVSDDTYLEDFGRELNVTSTRTLEQRGDLHYTDGHWSLLGRLQGFQTVDRGIPPQDRPYERLPQLLYVYDRMDLWQGMDFRLEAENVYFEHDHKVHGDRLAFRPTASLPLRRSYGHLIPRATLNHASYWLTDQEAGLPDSPSLTVPTFSLDGGLVFERGLDWFDAAATQTLEPRLFYLYTPYQDQDDLPVFDSAELDFTFASMFQDNRFTGRDRIGDANQLTLALTSRTIDDDDGRELFRGSIGQILYFQNRRVQLRGVEDEDNRSAVGGELAARLGGHWSSRASIFWDPNRSEEQMRNNSIGLYYHSPQQRLLNLTYRLNNSDQGDDTSFENTDMSFLWPVNPHLKLVGRWLYSLRDDKTMEAFAGVQYGQCCWKVRALVRSFLNSPDDDPNLSFMLQMELASLGTFGNDIEEFLERGVYGYEVE